MYAVIRAGGKQYRVSPGDTIKIEKVTAENGRIEFNDVLAVSGDKGGLGKVAGALVVGNVVEEARAPKIMVFHFKRKKQYKKLYGHRQPYTAVRIVEINSGDQKFTAPDLPAKKEKAAAKPAKAPLLTRGPGPRIKAGSLPVSGDAHAAVHKTHREEEVKAKKVAHDKHTKPATGAIAQPPVKKTPRSGKKPNKKN